MLSSEAEQREPAVAGLRSWVARRARARGARRFAPLAIALLLLAIPFLVLTSRNVRAEAEMPAPAAPPSPTLDYDLRFAAFDAGRMANAAIPYARGSVWEAEPFVFDGSVEDRERAITCLASAVWYEAGDDRKGEQAVAQVVINRTRHPIFPKTVCGVVFQRASPTGTCQFTFTCDGSFRRLPSLAAWQRAREVAEQALAGFVYAPVGTATFYHADSVVPYWSRTFDKIARVGSHLFYRLRGALGRPEAFTGGYRGDERLDARLVALSKAIGGTGGPVEDQPAILASASPAMPAALEPAPALPSVPGVDLRGSVLRLIDQAGNRFGLQLNPTAFPGTYAVVALGLCHDKPACTVMGWLQPRLVPAALPASATPTLTFLYRKDERGGEQLLWNCREVARSDPRQCLPGTVAQPAA